MLRRFSKRTFVLSITALLSVVVLSQPAGATLIAYEGFRPSFPVYASGGTGFSGPWVGSGYTTRLKSLCVTKLEASEGGSVAGEPGGGISRALLAPLGVTGTTRYISFLIQPVSFDPVFSFFGLELFGTLGALHVGKPGHDATDQYVIEDFGGLNQVVSGVPVVAGRTALLVVKFNFNAANDVITLYVDPTPGRLEPSSTAVKVNLNLGTVTFISFVSFGATSIIDEIRIGDTYADVVPSGNNQPDPDFLGCLGN
jgi:hypothetical protein